MSSFKSAVGMGAIEYALEIRIKKACEMLCKGEKTYPKLHLTADSRIFQTSISTSKE